MTDNNLIKKFRKKLTSRNSSVIGGWVQICEPTIVEIVSSYKYDFVCFDLEHGLFSTTNLANLVRAAKINKKISLARLPNKNKDFCSQVLDTGCDGVIVPNIKTSKELIELRNLIHYPPKGKRGVGFSRENLFSKYFTKKIKIRKSPIFVAMIESREGIKNLKSILGVKGLDAILIGPYDLSSSLGITGKFNHKKFKEAILYIKKVTKKKKIPVGIHILENNFSALHEYKKQGYSFLPYCTDGMLLNTAIKSSFKKK